MMQIQCLNVKVWMFSNMLDHIPQSIFWECAPAKVSLMRRSSTSSLAKMYWKKFSHNEPERHSDSVWEFVCLVTIFLGACDMRRGLNSVGGS